MRGRGRGAGSAVARRPAPQGPRWRRAFALGFLVGAVLTLPAVLVGLLVPVVEVLLPFLVPGAELLRLLRLPSATWPGAVTMLLVVAANGLVVGAAAALVALVAERLRR